MALWNPWHGCKKISDGCKNCYVYRTDSKYGKDSAAVTRNQNFNLPVAKNKKGEYKIPSGELVYTCFTSDFFLQEADVWRREAWEIISKRKDLRFLIVTKRIHRFFDCLPADWGGGYDNVTVYCTVENQAMADYRLPLFAKAPILHKGIVCEPLLGPVDLSAYLNEHIIEVIAGGESGYYARPCDYEWVLKIRDCCVKYNVAFHFKQTGARFIKKGKLYHVERKYQHAQAKKANINWSPAD